MKKILLLALATLPLLLVAQTIQEIKSGDYYWGEAMLENEQLASDAALHQLLNQISMRIVSSYEGKLKETDAGVEESVESIVQTHSTATLRNVKTIRTSLPEGIYVMHYIQRNEVQRIWDNRKKLIYDIYKQAQEMEETGNLGNALKWYYFSAILINSLPDETAEYNGINFSLEVPARINAILLGVRYRFDSEQLYTDNERIIDLDVSYNDKPVSYIEFSFWDGYDNIRVTGKDGLATVHLLGASKDFDKLDIETRYNFDECRNEYKTVNELWDLVCKPSFKNRKSIRLEKPGKEKPKAIATKTQKAEATGSLNIVLEKSNECPVHEAIQTQTNDVIPLFNRKDTAQIEKFFPGDSFLQEKFRRIMKFNQPMVVHDEFHADINPTATGWETRKFTVLNEYPTLKKQVTEHLVYDFDDEGNMQDLNYSILDDLYQDFVEKSKVVDDWKQRQVIIKFVEKYRTAYMNRDEELLDSIFSDDAIIIIGRLMDKSEKTRDYHYDKLNDEQPDVEYIRLTKEQYMQRQKETFKRQQDIYLGFSTFRITRKNNLEGVYGVSMRQHYNSTGYSDEGYLFLLIDFNDEQPKIYVRSWQPQEWEEEKLVQLSNFRIHK